VTRRAHWALIAVLAVTGLLTGCETVEWWMVPENRGWIPKGNSYVVQGVIAVLAIPFVLYGIYKYGGDDDFGGGGG